MTFQNLKKFWNFLLTSYRQFFKLRIFWGANKFFNIFCFCAFISKSSFCLFPMMRRKTQSSHSSFLFCAIKRYFLEKKFLKETFFIFEKWKYFFFCDLTKKNWDLIKMLEDKIWSNLGKKVERDQRTLNLAFQPGLLEKPERRRNYSYGWLVEALLRCLWPLPDHRRRKR